MKLILEGTPQELADFLYEAETETDTCGDEGNQQEKVKTLSDNATKEDISNAVSAIIAFEESRKNLKTYIVQKVGRYGVVFKGKHAWKPELAMFLDREVAVWSDGCVFFEEILICNLSNKRDFVSYEYSKEDVAKTMKAVCDALANSGLPTCDERAETLKQVIQHQAK